MRRTNSPHDAPALTVADAVRIYLADREAEGQSTRRARQQLKAHVLPRWGDRLVATLTAPELKAWRDTLALTGPRKRRPMRVHVPRIAAVDLQDPEIRRRRRSTVNRITTIFKAALNHAARFYPQACPNGTAWREGLRAFRNVDAPRERWLRRQQIGPLLAACRPDFRRLVEAALYTGCRYGELCRARVEDFDAETKALAIPLSKSGKRRSVVLNDEAVAFFATLAEGRGPADWLLTRATTSVDGERAHHPDGRAREAAPWGPAQQVRPMRAACAAAGIEPPIPFHGLRHTYASLAVQSGMALIALARNLGHSDTRMVEKHYGHLSDRYLQEQVQRHAPQLGRTQPVKGH